MSLLQNAFRSSSIQRVHLRQGLRTLLSASPALRHFSTGSAPPTSHPSSTKPFFESSSEGLFYGKLVGITKNTLKSDVLSLLEECNLTRDDLKVEYNPAYLPTGMVIQFSTRNAYDAALRTVRKGQLYRLERADRAKWDYIQPYDGKYVLLEGIPPNASIDDIERFLVGSEYDPTNIRTFTRGATRMALVCFLTQTAAMSAAITKNRGFCLNNQVLMHVIQ